MDLVSSLVMLITKRLARKPNTKKFPVVRIWNEADWLYFTIHLYGRKRAETAGVILFVL
jgi:hypothetical protein